MQATKKQVESWLAEQRKFSRVGVIVPPVKRCGRRAKVVKRKIPIDGNFVREYDEVVFY